MYLNIYYEAGNETSPQSYIHVWDDKLGYKKIPNSKYAYKLDPDGDYITLYGQACKLVKRWKKEDLENGLIFESDVHPEMRYLVDNYMNSEEPSDAHVVMNLDIEVSTDGGLPDIYKAENEITSIAYFDDVVKEYTVHLLDPGMQMNDITMTQRGDIVHVFRHTTEEELLNAFLVDYESMRPTILTGWNIDFFDVPYLYNRIKNVFDAKTAHRLSPIGRVTFNKYAQRYFIAGVSCLDMMKLYKNFTFGERSSYSLDAIGKLEVKEGKVQYTGTLDKLYAEDKEKFVDYNVHDVRLVKMIDDKMKLILLAKGICHKGHVALEDVYFSSRFLDGAILTYLKRKGKIVVPNKPERAEESSYGEVGFSGAYVKEPIPGIYHWLVDLDATSMYPSIIMTLNISPECKVARLESWSSSDFQKGIEKTYKINLGDKELSFSKDEFNKFISQENLGVSSNGVLYELTNKGIIPEILEVWFDERTEMKKLVKKHGKELNDDGSINMHYDKSKLEFYNTRQKIQKTLLNSLYGVLGLQSFRYYDLDNAEAVTTTGVDLIKFAQSVTNMYYEKALNKKDDYIIYTDTDSIFFSVEKLVREKYPDVDMTDDTQVVDAILKLARDIQNYVNKSMDYFALKFLGVKSHKFNMKQEVIAKSGLWTTKKRYALWAINIEGRTVDELEVKGLDSVRTSFPKLFRDFMKSMLKNILMGKPKDNIDVDILELKTKVNDVDIIDISRPTSIKEISKFCDNTHQPFNFSLKGTPAHVKAAINYNDFLRYYDLDKKFPYVGDGEKIKWVYLVPENPFRLDALAFKDNDEDPIEVIEYVKMYIDRSKVFDSEMEKKLHDFYVALGWGNIPTKVYQEHSKFF